MSKVQSIRTIPTYLHSNCSPNFPTHKEGTAVILVCQSSSLLFYSRPKTREQVVKQGETIVDTMLECQRGKARLFGKILASDFLIPYATRDTSQRKSKGCFCFYYETRIVYVAPLSATRNGSCPTILLSSSSSFFLSLSPSSFLTLRGVCESSVTD